MLWLRSLLRHLPPVNEQETGSIAWYSAVDARATSLLEEGGARLKMLI